VAISFVWHSETAESLGLSLRACIGAVAAWRWWLASCAASLSALTWLETATTIHVIYRWCGYACWCVLQQLKTWPTGGYGTEWRVVEDVSTRLFEARPSVSVLGVTQALLSAMLYVVTPVAWNGQFRVGLDIGLYYIRHSSPLFSFNGFSNA